MLNPVQVFDYVHRVCIRPFIRFSGFSISFSSLERAPRVSLRPLQLASFDASAPEKGAGSSGLLSSKA